MDMGTTTMAMDMGMGMDMSSSTMSMNMGDMVATATTTGITMEMASGAMTMAMPMGTATSSAMSMNMSCTMSMLWNWYTKDVCFIAESWKTSTKGIFAGTCIGVFGLLLAINWWRRILSQYKIYCAELRSEEVDDFISAGGEVTVKAPPSEAMTPFFQTLKHEWFWRLDKNLCVEVDGQIYIYPSIFEHLLYCVGDTMEWSVHHCVMLLFMYFNGYVFISCMIGAGIGFMIFQNKPLDKAQGGDKVSKRCCL